MDKFAKSDSLRAKNLQKFLHYRITTATKLFSIVNLKQTFIHQSSQSNATSIKYISSKIISRTLFETKFNSIIIAMNTSNSEHFEQKRSNILLSLGMNVHENTLNK
eukprot:413802_1